MVDLTAHLDTYDALSQEIADLEIKRGRLLIQMRVILEQDGATEYPDHPKFTVKIESKTEWDEPSLDRLGEHYDAEGLAELKNKPRKPTFDKRKLLSLLKYGGAKAKIIREAQIKGAPEIKVKEKN